MPTLKDVATRAKVSPTLASFVLNNKAESNKISKETSRRVKETARKMGYKIDTMARALTTGRTNVIGFVSPVLYKSITAGRVISGMIHAANENNFLIKMINARDFNFKRDDALIKECDKIIEICVTQRLAALICHLVLSKEAISYLYKQLKKNGIELATITCTWSPEDSCAVVSDDIKAGEIAVEHLYQLGHRKIAFASLAHESLHQRYIGFENKMNEHKLSIPNNYVINGNHEFIKNNLAKTFTGQQRPTAIFCSGDDTALLIVSKITNEFNIKIPDDLSIVGCGDFAYGKIMSPALTTVYEPFMEMGERVVEKLMARFNKKDDGGNREIVDVHIIKRGSTRKIV